MEHLKGNQMKRDIHLRMAQAIAANEEESDSDPDKSLSKKKLFESSDANKRPSE
jgi:hypothetical protein